MKSTIRTLIAAGSIVLYLLTVSCGAKISNKETDPSFDPPALKNGGLAILGCTSIVPEHPGPLELSQELAIPLREALLDKTRDVDIVPWGDVRRALGDERTLACLVANDKYGSLDEAMIDTLATEIGSLARYAVIHRLESDVVELSSTDNSETVDGKSVVTSTTLKTKRTLTGAFTVYDLQGGIRVWKARIQGNKTTENTVDEGGGFEIGGWLGQVVDVVDAMEEIFGDDESPYPRPATNTEIMDKLYKKFAEELPKEE